jgi:2-polyprenyl-6-methoxyphenol hydroxylase-like FAD-dependent oxidoreductase
MSRRLEVKPARADERVDLHASAALVLGGADRRRSSLMAKVQNVLIVGGGIGGLSAAIGLGRAGISAEIVEIKDEWAIHGVGIIQPGNAIRAYKALGVADRCIEQGFVFARQRHYDADGKLIGERAMPPIEGLDLVGHCGIPRPVLQEILVAAATDVGARIRMGVTVKALHDRRGGIEVDFTDGSSGSYDLVIGADGTYSSLREMVFGDIYKPRFSGQGCWRFSTEKPPEMDWSCAFHGPNKAGLIPLTRDTMYMFLTTSEPGNPWMPNDRLHDLMRERLHGHRGLAGEVRERIRRSESVVYKPLETLLVPRPWYRGRVLLIGDAAHTTTPHHAQGAAMAVEDAVVLSEVLRQDGELDDLLERFMERRWGRCRLVVEASVQVGEWEQNPTQTSTADAIALSNHVRLQLAHAL